MYPCTENGIGEYRREAGRKIGPFGKTSIRPAELRRREKCMRMIKMNVPDNDLYLLRRLL
jgi:hypothetical protein